MDGCPPIPGYVTAGQASYATKCLARNEYAFTYFTEHHFKRVILAADWGHDPASNTLIEAAVERALGAGAQVTEYDPREPADTERGDVSHPKPDVPDQPSGARRWRIPLPPTWARIRSR